MTRVSIRDVAAETGYSPATVSNVLNEKGNVGAKATHIILEAIARLGYSRFLASFLRLRASTATSSTKAPFKQVFIPASNALLAGLDCRRRW